MRVQKSTSLRGFFPVGDSENLEPGAKPMPGAAPSGPMSIVSHPLYVPLPPPISRQGRPVHEITLTASAPDLWVQRYWPSPGEPEVPKLHPSGPEVPKLHGYVIERQIVDPLRPVP